MNFSFFNAEAQVLTLNGFKNIDKVLNTDFVLNHKGAWAKVNTLISKQEIPLKIELYDGTILETTLDTHVGSEKQERISIENLPIGEPISVVPQTSSINNTNKNILSKSLEEQLDFLNTDFLLLKFNSNVFTPFSEYSNALTLQRLYLNTFKKFSPITFEENYYIVSVNKENNNTSYFNFFKNIEIGSDEKLLYGLDVVDQSYTINNFVVYNV